MRIEEREEGTMPEYMGSKEAARLWNTSQAQVAKWCRENKLRSGTKPCEQDKPGSPWRIRRDAIPPIQDFESERIQ